MRARGTFCFFFFRLLGDGYIGCFEESLLSNSDYEYSQQSLASVTPQKCTVLCKTYQFPYAALYQGKRYVEKLQRETQNL